MIALDTETTGLDFWHGARPYLVTTCSETGELRWWEWDVDPLTREVDAPEDDLREIRSILSRIRRSKTDRLVAQNGKFDAHALHSVGIENWPWSAFDDTLIAAHLLASNQPHDLTALAMQYLEWDVEHFEKRLKLCTDSARNLARRHHPNWAIAKKDRPDMPSTKEKAWKIDAWLPRAVAKFYEHPRPDPLCGAEDEEGRGLRHRWGKDHLCVSCGGHEFWTVTSTYANSDSAATVQAWGRMVELLEGQGLTAIYRNRMELVPVLWRMEHRGVTLNAERHDYLRRTYRVEAERENETLVALAEEEGYQLDLPKGNRNDSLTRFCFGYAIAKCEKCGNAQFVDRDRVESLKKLEAKGSECQRCKKAGTFPPGRPTVTDYPCLDLPVLKRSEDTGAPSLDKEVISDYLTAELEPDSAQWRFVKALSIKRKRDMSLQFLDSYERFWLPSMEFVVNRRGASEALTLQTAQAIGRLMEAARTAVAAGVGVSWENPWRVMHPSVNPTGTDTLRLSCNNPNAQQVDKHPDNRGFSLREVFGPGEGREWWKADFENLELRIPAFEADERELIEVFLCPDDPPYFGSYHLVIFDVLHPEKFRQFGHGCKEEFAATWYQWVKNGNFAVLYGAMERKADATFKVPGAFRKIRHRFPKMAAFADRMTKYAERYGHVETIPNKRVSKRGYPLMVARSAWGNQNVEPTKPLNYRVQGTACDAANQAAILCDERLEQWRSEGFDAFITLYVHDELVFDFPKGGRRNLPKARALKGIMEGIGDDYGVPLKVDLKYCPVSWAKSEEPK